MSQTLEKIIEEVKNLSEAERNQLIVILHGANGSAPAASVEHEFEGRLAAEGWLSLPTTPPAGSPPLQLAAPLAVPGRPLSEILVEERR
jgi:hypothetical protein